MRRGQGEQEQTGTPPDLAGHWLAVVVIEEPDKTVISSPIAWDIAVRDGKPVLPIDSSRFRHH